jgi:Ca2+/Na+ antiporter
MERKIKAVLITALIVIGICGLTALSILNEALFITILVIIFGILCILLIFFAVYFFLETEETINRMRNRNK